MTKETETLVKLKYEMITADESTWDRLETYPKEAVDNWAWRCAADVEHFADGHKEAMECIRIAKAYSDGTATLDELHAAHAVADGASAATCDSFSKQFDIHLTWLFEELCEWEAKQ